MNKNKIEHFTNDLETDFTRYKTQDLQKYNISSSRYDILADR